MMKIDKKQNLIEYRIYGQAGPVVFVLHGGPGAAGYMAPVCRQLAKAFQVIEPLQRRGSKDKPVSVTSHVKDLRDLIDAVCPDSRPAIVGHSWGAFLALAYTAQYPNKISSLVLIGSTTLDNASRRTLKMIREQRMNESARKRLEQLQSKAATPDKALAALGSFYQKLESYELIGFNNELKYCDALGHNQTRADVVRLLDSEVYPKGFAGITCPTIMLHGDFDAHPGILTRDSLIPYIPQLQYQEWQKCGHYPWLEKHAYKGFYTTLKNWLTTTAMKLKEQTDD